MRRVHVEARRYGSRIPASPSPGLPGRGPGRLLRAAAVVAGTALIGACSGLAGPEYERPEVPEKAAWSRDDGKALATETIRPDWWAEFGDSYLDRLVDKAVTDSSDIRVLTARLNVARASIGQAQARFLPTITGDTSVTRVISNIPDTSGGFGGGGPGTLGGVPVDPNNPGSPGDPNSAGGGDGSGGGGGQKFDRDITNNFDARTTVSWELDFWGKLAKGVEARKAGFKATEATWRAGYLTLVSNVANTYFRIRRLDEQIVQQEKALKRNEMMLAIYENQNREGLVADTRVLQQKAQVNQRKKQLLELQRRRQVNENRIATLLGEPAGDFKVPPGGLQDTVSEIEVPVGLPSSLLSRRPDIIAAEYRVLQQHNLTGQARLARLPTISLTANGGFRSTELSSLLRTWTLGFGPRINFPIFDPNIQARIKVQEARTKVAEENYRKTVFKAFEEVENALVNLASHKQQKEVVAERVAHLRIVNQQVYARLKEGLVSQLEVFEADRTLLQAEQELYALHQQILTDTVVLYKALGGGWPEEEFGLQEVASGG